MAYVSSMSSNTKEELHTNIAAAGFMGLKTLADNSKAKKEKKQAERNARTKMLNFKEEIIEAYNNGLNESINTLVNTPNENVEQYAIDLNQYYQCLIKEVNNNFSYKSSSWSTPSSLCKQPVAARVIEKEVTSDDYLKISKRKFKFYGKYNDERFFESAKMYVNKAIESDKKNASAYIYRAIINGNDIIEQYRDVLIAEYLKGNKFNDKSLKKEIENQFNQEYKVAVNVSDIVFLERAATYELYPSDKLYSPIQTAIKLNNAAVFAILAKQKTELYSKYKFDYFLQATINNNNNIVDYIIKNEPSEFVKDIKIKDALEIAFFNDNHVIFNLLLDNGALTKYLDQKVLSNQVLKTKYAYYLINAGYTLGKLNLVKKGNEFYEFPEDFYVSTLVNGQKEKESNEITSYFLSKIKNKIIKVNGNSLYHIAIKNDDLSLLNNLALQGFEKNILDDDGFNFISAIAIYGPDEVLNNLSNLNLDLNIKDERGMTLLHYCALANHPNMVYIAEKILETKNVNVNTQNNMGYTPLHYAGKNNDLSMYMTLLNYNADKTIKDNKGQLAKLK
ncbi:ankyrin repeat domain-containing protein [Wenyingzhuangia marina]|uniref:Ankyrin repeat n=1 Tax=Wenyingzhuangia marina TaxID=1195760 RepID=A0A1M5TWV8_9FLAO|nr:ankyrin repeat domain-containing protein [Wenyingzhuangia marina]GGF70690.1 hypothetical protein GCM10011397_12070 [Wenyingzhuangia marina]SHH55090.1 Ankyrin repeat [Wenyingzhuangia marina]